MSQRKTQVEDANNERANEKLQQDDINKEIDDIKKDMIDMREYLQDEEMEKRMKELLKQLPREDRIRNLIDEDRERFNKNLSRGKSSIKKKLK